VNPLLDWLVAHGGDLLLGVTIVLAVGGAAAAVCRQAAERRRVGLYTAFGCALYLVAASLPLPRWTPADELRPRTEPAATAAAPDPAPVFESSTDEAVDQNVDAAPVLSPVAPPSAPAATAEPVSWPHVAAAIWLAAAGLFLLRALFGVLRLHRELRHTRPGPADLAETLPGRARLRVTSRALRPFCAGVWRPVVVLPQTLLVPTGRSAALAVLRHEAAHLRARDPLAQLLLAALAVPLGLHPLFWWLRRDVRFCSERLADETAAAGNRAAYARDLLEFAERAAPTFTAATAVPVFHRPSEFYRRIQMLLESRRPSSPPSPLRRGAQACVAAAVVGACAFVFGVPANAQDPPPQSPQTTATLQAELDALRAEVKSLRAQLAAPAPPQEYTVQKGDTMARIAEQFLGDAKRAQEFLALNPGIDPQRLVVGQKVRLPVDTIMKVEPPAQPTRAFLVGPDGLPAGPAINLAPTERAPTATAEATADLASRYLDLQAELQLAEVRATELQSLAAAGHVPTSEGRQAAAHLATLQKKVAIVRRLLEGEIAATESELAWLEQQRRQLDKTERLRLDAQVHRARVRLEALRAAK
jgi:beta-lactamase regulating signal transducer with metallopeptidase domain/LysM repeat protein